MGKLLIEPKTLKDLKENPDKFTELTIEFYNKAVNEAEQSDEYTVISVDLATKQDSDYSAYTKGRFVNGRIIVEKCVYSEDYIKEHFPMCCMTFKNNNSEKEI